MGATYYVGIVWVCGSVGVPFRHCDDCVCCCRNECRCDNNYGRYGRESSDRKCDEECTRDSSQICGGDFANSIYQIRGKTTL